MVVMEDLIRILSVKFYLVEVLFQLYDFIHHVDGKLELDLETGEGEAKLTKLMRKQLSQIKHKLIFYLALVKGKGQNEIDLWKKSISEFLVKLNNTREKLKDMKEVKSKVRIFK